MAADPETVDETAEVGTALVAPETRASAPAFRSCNFARYLQRSIELEVRSTNGGDAPVPLPMRRPEPSPSNVQLSAAYGEAGPARKVRVVGEPSFRTPSRSRSDLAGAPSAHCIPAQITTKSLACSAALLESTAICKAAPAPLPSAS
jgi:hypothetical protein